MPPKGALVMVCIHTIDDATVVGVQSVREASKEVT